MKTTFGRLFLSATFILLIAVLLVGISFQLLLRSNLSEHTVEDLQQDAQTYCDLATAYHNQGNLLDDDFLVNLSLASRLTSSDAVICSVDGTVLLCSEAPLGCMHQGLQITDRQYLERILTGDGSVDTGVIDGLYPDARFVVSKPIWSDDHMPVGIVIVSAPTSSTQPIISRLSNSYMTVSVLAVVVCLCLILLFARLQAKPLRQISQAAHEFGHGNLNARMPLENLPSVEMQELAISFNNMAASLQKIESQRQEFVANVSHELKTPMTTISGYLDGILDGTIPPERHKHYMQLVTEETKRLSRLVRSMLEVSRLQDQGGIPEERKQRFDVSDLAGQVLLQFEQKILEKKLDVQVQLPDYPLYTRADPDAITQVFYNLVDNGVKFCQPEKALGLTIRSSGDKIYVTVSNEGQTIPAQELPFLFDRFHKLDKSRSQNRDGWGLGLYIVKTLVSSHGQDISVFSVDGKTEFTFTLPLVT